MAEELVPTEPSWRRLGTPDGQMHSGVLRQGARVVWACQHAHPGRLAAIQCARDAAGAWPGRDRWLAGPCRVEKFRLPRLPTLVLTRSGQ